MKNLLHPRWLLLVNSLPLAILFVLYFAQYNIIKSLLSTETLHHWLLCGGALSLIGITTAAYSFLEKRELSLSYGAISLFINTLFLYFYTTHNEYVIPRDIPIWMLSNELPLYLGTFLMPTLIHDLLVIMLHLTDENKPHKAWKNFLISIGIPIVLYIFALGILPMWGGFLEGFSEHIYILFLLTIVILFLFFVMRGVYILTIQKASKNDSKSQFWSITIGTIMPLLGLLISNFGTSPFRNAFGDFSNLWFYSIAFANGILLFFPESEKPFFRLMLYLGRCVGFAYVMYFFLVFLPFLPFSVLVIIVFGLGFLMLTPLLLFILQGNVLYKDYTFLSQFYPKKKIIISSLSAFCLIPFCITFYFLYEKKVLNEALEYLYQPDFSKSYDIEKEPIRKVLNEIKTYTKPSSNSFLEKDFTPYLSTYFNWLVMDNMTLSDTKIKQLETVFYGESNINNLNFNRNRNEASGAVKISKTNTHTTFDASQNAWRTWVDLDITNQSEFRNQEFATTLELPEGCWISDYYLYVGDKKEMGILAEKKAAMWVFNQIQNTNRDPGILHYLTGNQVKFRIFPFSENEIRKTGIEFLHKEPIKIDLDGNKISLGDATQQTPTITNNTALNGAISYISAKEKATLPIVQRTPYYHFIVDISKGKDTTITQYTQQIERLLSEKRISADNAKITFCNTYAKTFSFGKDWKEKLKTQTCEGGFFLDRALKQTFFDAFSSKKMQYPVIVVLTNDWQNAIIENDFSNFKMAFPERNLFFGFNQNGQLAAHSLEKNPRQMTKNALNFDFNLSVLAYPDTQNPKAFLPNDGKSSIALQSDFFNKNDLKIGKKKWQSGLAIQALWFSQVFHPERVNKEWHTLLKASFQSKIMSPLTSYLVVENEAQKAMLFKKQAEVINGNKALDLDDEVQRASEPSLWLMLFLLGGILAWKKRCIFQTNRIFAKK